MSRSKAGDLKRRAQKTADDVHVSIVGEPTIFVQMENHWRLDFKKLVVSAQTSSEYDAYLVVQPRSDGYEIVAESDRATDTHLGVRPCEFIIRRTLEEFIGTAQLGVNDYILEASPEASKGRAESSPKYIFGVGLYHAGADRYTEVGRVRLAADTGAAEIECGSSFSWEPFCATFGRGIEPGTFQAVRFQPSIAPASDPACAEISKARRNAPSR